MLTREGKKVRAPINVNFSFPQLKLGDQLLSCLNKSLMLIHVAYEHGVEKFLWYRSAKLISTSSKTDSFYDLNTNFLCTVIT